MAMREGANGSSPAGGTWRVTGRMVLIGLFAFFGVVFLANGVMMWMAARTFDGLDEPDAYRRGIHYNERLHEAALQRRLGWRFDLEVPPAETGDPRERWVELRARDRDDAPLARLTLRAAFRSPVNAHEDRAVALFPDPAASGLYRARVRLPRIGKWQLVLEAEDTTGHHWRGVFDLYLPPDTGRG